MKADRHSAWCAAACRCSLYSAHAVHSAPRHIEGGANCTCYAAECRCRPRSVHAVHSAPICRAAACRCRPPSVHAVHSAPCRVEGGVKVKQ
eukprot:scaffold96124_cov36-Tisochrysis_lutea.AAC.2